MQALFRPNPTVRRIPLFDGQECLVVDDALVEPAAMVAWACARRADFRPTGHAYPGVELWLDDRHTAQLADFFMAHPGPVLGAASVVNAACRASLVSVPPASLAPLQRICHRDNRGVPEGERMFASVLYLFEDPALGGTSFYRARRPQPEVEALVHDSRVLRGPAFEARYPELGSGYMVEGNDWFERVASVPARFNRIVFYDGGVFHSGDICCPDRMSADPAAGRLTINGFLRCRDGARRADG